MTTLIESNEHKSLREAVAAFAKTHPHTLNAEDNKRLWQEAAKLGYIGVNLPEAHGGGGA
ncbi:acyl-CoA dehydrogenase family protein, partial [Streptomyces sp. NPDC048306]